VLSLSFFFLAITNFDVVQIYRQPMHGKSSMIKQQDSIEGRKFLLVRVDSVASGNGAAALSSTLLFDEMMKRSALYIRKCFMMSINPAGKFFKKKFVPAVMPAHDEMLFI
jgi:hypothetical protein